MSFSARRREHFAVASAVVVVVVVAARRRRHRSARRECLVWFCVCACDCVCAYAKTRIRSETLVRATDAVVCRLQQRRVTLKVCVCVCARERGTPLELVRRVCACLADTYKHHYNG